MFRELCGDMALKNVAIVTNMWDKVSRDIGEARENELSDNFCKPVLDKGAQMFRHHNTAESAHDILRKIVVNPPVVLQIQRELADEHKDLISTAAGKAINRELNEQIEQYQVEMKRVEEEVMQALEEKDEETRGELEEETKRLRERVRRIKEDSERMTANYAVEKDRMEARVMAMEQKAKKREETEAERKRGSADFNHRFQDTAYPNRLRR